MREPFQLGETTRSYLLLQGPIGPFFAMLGARLRRSGNRVFQIAFNGGDSLFSGGKAEAFRGGPEAWPGFLRDRLMRWGITDIVLFGDCRPLHRAAIAVAQSHAIPVHVFEEGYLRPNWVTLERGGVNGHSSLPRDPDLYRDEAAQLPALQPAVSVPYHFPTRAALDVLYQLASVAASARYPGYRSHKPWHPLAEYRSGAKRFCAGPIRRRRSAGRMEQLLHSGRPYYLFPLQLEADSQIRFHFPYGSMVPAIRQIVDSFAKTAPADAVLAVTEHPLDTGVVDLQAVVMAAAATSGLGDRLIYLHGGSPDVLIRRSRGLVTVNSTVAIQALMCGVPVKSLGRSIYNLSGLCFQGELDQFWSRAAAPDSSLLDGFIRVVAARTQINGGFHSFAALRLAADAAAARLSAASASVRIAPKSSVPRPALVELVPPECAVPVE